MMDSEFHSCDTCRFRNNKLRCACCIYVWQRINREGLFVRAMLLPQRDMYERKKDEIGEELDIVTLEAFEKAKKLYDERQRIVTHLNNVVDWQNYFSDLHGFGIRINGSQHSLDCVRIYPTAEEMNAMLSTMIERLTSDLNELDRELKAL